MARVGAERRAQPDFARPPRDADGHQREDSERRQKQDEHGHRCQRAGLHRQPVIPLPNPCVQRLRVPDEQSASTSAAMSRQIARRVGPDCHARAHSSRAETPSRPTPRETHTVVRRPSRRGPGRRRARRPRSRTTAPLAAASVARIDVGIPEAGADRRSASGLARKLARERLVDDRPFGRRDSSRPRGRHARRQSDDRWLRRILVPPPTSEIHGRTSARRRVTTRPLRIVVLASDPGARSANVTATTPGSCAMRRSSAANVCARRSSNAVEAVLVERPVQIDASGEILSTWKCGADVQLEHRLVRASPWRSGCRWPSAPPGRSSRPSRRARSAAWHRRPDSRGAIARALAWLAAQAGTTTSPR